MCIRRMHQRRPFLNDLTSRVAVAVKRTQALLASAGATGDQSTSMSSDRSAQDHRCRLGRTDTRHILKSGRERPGSLAGTACNTLMSRNPYCVEVRCSDWFGRTHSQTVSSQRVPANHRGPSVGQLVQRTGTTPLTAHARAFSTIDRSPPFPSSRWCNLCSRSRRGPSASDAT